MIRIPFPTDPERRRDLFARAAAALERHGSYQGTTDEGTFQGKTPIGEFAGSYRFLPDPGELEIVLSRKPWLVPVSLVEHELRKFITKV